MSDLLEHGSERLGHLLASARMESDRNGFRWIGVPIGQSRAQAHDRGNRSVRLIHIGFRQIDDPLPGEQCPLELPFCL